MQTSCAPPDSLTGKNGGRPTLDETRAFIRELFAGVTDKAGRPYTEHCERVEGYLGPDATEDERHAALLHDVLANTKIGLNGLWLRGYSHRTRDLIKGLSKPEGTSYFGYIDQIAATGDVGLIRIKLADCRDNMDPERVSRLDAHTRARLKLKYLPARCALDAALYWATEPTVQ
jgi:(p)ppGpp synthase/HD superfamily hydrolase